MSLLSVNSTKPVIKNIKMFNSHGNVLKYLIDISFAEEFSRFIFKGMNTCRAYRFIQGSWVQMILCNMWKFSTDSSIETKTSSFQNVVIEFMYK